MDSLFALFNWLDWAIVVIFVLSALSGFVKGFFKEIYSLVVWVIAAVLTYFFSDILAEKAFSWLSDPQVSLLFSKAAILLGTWIIGRALAVVLNSGNHGSFLSRVLGMLVSLVKTFIFLVLVIHVASLSNQISQSSFWQDSYLINHISTVSSWMDKNEKNLERNKNQTFNTKDQNQFDKSYIN